MVTDHFETLAPPLGAPGTTTFVATRPVDIPSDEEISSNDGVSMIGTPNESSTPLSVENTRQRKV